MWVLKDTKQIKDSELGWDFRTRLEAQWHHGLNDTTPQTKWGHELVHWINVCYWLKNRFLNLHQWNYGEATDCITQLGNNTSLSS